jgi:hypothetical protein
MWFRSAVSSRVEYLRLDEHPHNYRLQSVTLICPEEHLHSGRSFCTLNIPLNLEQSVLLL